MRRIFSVVSLVITCLLAAPAVAENAADVDDQPAAAPEQSDDSASVTVESESGATWSLHARLRPRLEGRWHHRFGLSPDELNYVNVDQTDNFTNQTRLGAGVELGDLTADLLLQHAAVWGTTGGDALTDPSLDIHRASLTWAPTDTWSLQAGRFALAYGDERVLGAVGWSQVGRAWDGLRTEFAPVDGLEVDLFGARYAEGASTSLAGFEGGFLEDDALLGGLYASASKSLLGILEAADLYALYDVRIDRLDTDVPNRRDLTTIGTRLDGTWKPVDANLEAAYQLGQQCVEGTAAGNCTAETVDRRGWFVDVEVGATFLDSPTTRLFAAYSRASGDDPDTATVEAYDHLYPTGHKWLGFTDIIGPRTNLQEIRGGLTLDFGPVAVRESVHHFTRLEPTTEPAGLEFDTTVGISPSEHLSIHVGHGLFVPDDGITSTDASPDGVANWAFLQFVARL